MVSLKFSMSQRAGSTVPQFRIRVPTKIVDRLRGKRVLLSISTPDDYPPTCERQGRAKDRRRKRDRHSAPYWGPRRP